MQQPLVVTVILNTNRREDTLAALDSLFQSTYSNHKVVVLDNDSKDGSVTAIQSAYSQVQVIELDHNLGYAGNNNVGIQAAMDMGAEWVLVLNEDTLLAPDCLAEMVRVGESHPQIGVIGPMVYHHDEPGVIQSAGGKIGSNWQTWHLAQNEDDRGQYTEPHAVDWISGCAIMVRRGVIHQVGMLDARFFYYFEETEWCLRAHRAGWQVIHAPQARLWHKGVQRNYFPGPNVTYYSTRNRFLMFSKHRAPSKAWFLAWMEVFRTLTSWSLKPKWRSMRPHRDAMWQGTVDFLRGNWGIRPG
ncbi:MAG TPA: glycosyltransferase family 2 protein [Anaerolineales bacterium]|nr:glycosyltransferase family 2 protein [Anaerolineales bacterium]